jgi:RHS repeat-associated protein
VLDLRFPGQQYDSATGFNYNYFRDYDPSTGRYVESDPIGLSGGASTYGYASGRPGMNTDALGLKDYDECETRSILLMIIDNLYPDLGKGFLWRYYDGNPMVKTYRAFNGHTGSGKYDFKYMQEYIGVPVTFHINGTTYSAAQFGNFAAGYMGAWYGPGGYLSVRAGGVAFDIAENWGTSDSDWDDDSIPDIDAGYEMAKKEINSGKINMCGCDNPEKIRWIELPALQDDHRR